MPEDDRAARHAVLPQILLRGGAGETRSAAGRVSSAGGSSSASRSAAPTSAVPRGNINPTSHSPSFICPNRNSSFRSSMRTAPALLPPSPSPPAAGCRSQTRRPMLSGVHQSGTPCRGSCKRWHGRANGRSVSDGTTGSFSMHGRRASARGVSPVSVVAGERVRACAPARASSGRRRSSHAARCRRPA